MLWNRELLAKIDAADDLKIAPYRPDMNTTGTPTWIWEVTVDNRLFVRAYIEQAHRVRFLSLRGMSESCA